MFYRANRPFLTFFITFAYRSRLKGPVFFAYKSREIDPVRIHVGTPPFFANSFLLTAHARNTPPPGQRGKGERGQGGWAGWLGLAGGWAGWLGLAGWLGWLAGLGWVAGLAWVAGLGWWHGWSGLVGWYGSMGTGGMAGMGLWKGLSVSIYTWIKRALRARNGLPNYISGSYYVIILKNDITSRY